MRKPDAERAIEKMQGFPIGGSRIRLSWGRSQCTFPFFASIDRSSDPPADKAAQAAAQAAQAAALQAQYQAHVQQQMQMQGQGHQAPSQQAPQQQPSPPNNLTPAQALQALEQWGLSHLLKGGTSSVGGMLENVSNERQIAAALLNDVDGDRMASLNAFAPPIFAPRQTGNAPSTSSNFAPFSPDPAYLGDRANSDAQNAQGQSMSQTSKSYSPWYNLDEKSSGSNGKASPTSMSTARTPNVPPRFPPFLGDPPTPSVYQPVRTSSRQEAPIARPEVVRRGSQKEDFSAPVQEQDAIRDLNGTVASLSLDDHDNANAQSPSAAH